MEREDDLDDGRTRIQSASRAIRILLAVAATQDGLKAKEIADAFGLSLPTAYHLLNTLTNEGVLFKDERRRYLIGPRAAVIAEAVNNSNTVPDGYVKALHALAERTGETAYLSVWRRNEIVVLATVEGSQAVRVTGLTAGYSDNIHARASGKLLLAFAPAPVRKTLIEGLVLRRLTHATITSRAALRRELERIRAEGISFDHQEFQDGVECVSAPIRSGDKVVACFTVSTPAGRFGRRQQMIVETLLSAVAAAAG
ncbi:MAG: IclR family transcriptional regulator [Microbacteriaceae bacterium]|nr:MAG: IclR family transcriptional regulator [Microbacteriaceae bacterium]